jgi:hypothetical protein
MARSSEFDDHILPMVDDYLESYEGQIPTIAGLSLHLDVSRSTIYRWADMESHPEGLVDDEIYSQLRHKLEKLKAMAEQKLIGKGLTGDFNPAITKLMLTKHGYSDKQQTELTGADGGPIQTDSVFEFVPVDSDS